MRRHLGVQGIWIAKRTIVDTTIISAPSLSKNRAEKRGPDMHQTRKGDELDFGMKGHFGVYSRSKLIHSVVASPANVQHRRNCRKGLVDELERPQSPTKPAARVKGEHRIGVVKRIFGFVTVRYFEFKKNGRLFANYALADLHLVRSRPPHLAEA